MSKAAFLTRRIVPVEFGGGTYYVRAMSGAQVEALIKGEGDEALDGIRALSLVCLFCVVDESGAPLFAESDLPELRENGDFAMIKAIGEHALELSGLGDSAGNG